MPRRKRQTYAGLWEPSTLEAPELLRSRDPTRLGYLKHFDFDELTESSLTHGAATPVHRLGTWIAKTTSRPRRPWACSAQGPAACGAMRPFSPGATSYWIAAASSLVVGLQSPATCATRAGGDSDPNIENCYLFHAQSPDTGNGAHARS